MTVKNDRYKNFYSGWLEDCGAGKMITVSPSARTVYRNRHSDMAKQFLTTVPKKWEFSRNAGPIKHPYKKPHELISHRTCKN